MATATAVTIKVVVDGSQAGPAIDQINQGLAQIGVKGTASMNQAAGAANTMAGGMTKGLDSVRLMSQEFGLRLPRAIEHWLASMPAVTNAIQSVFSVMAGLVALQVFERLAEGAYHLYEKYLSVQAVQDEFYESVKKTAETEFANTRSIEDTRLRIDQATQSMVAYNKAAEGSQKSGWATLFSNLGNPAGMAAGAVDLMGAHNLAEGGATAGKQMMQLTPKQIEQQHELNVLNIEAAHAKDAELGASAKITAELEKQKALHGENRKFGHAMDISMGNPTSTDAGSAEEAAQNQIAAGKASEQTIALYRKERDERIEAQNAAVLSGLDGEAKLEAEKQQAIDKIVQRYKDGEISKRTEDAMTAAASEKFDNERYDRVTKQITDAQKTLRDANSSGLTGAAKITAEHDAKVEDINTDRSLDPNAASLLRQAAKVKMDQDMGQFWDESDMKEAEDMQRSAEQHARILDEEVNYAKQAAEAERRVRGTGLTGWVTDYQNAVAAIEAQDAAETQKLQGLVATGKMTQAEYQEAKVNIDRTANAQIQQQNQEMSHQIANTLEQAFANPVDFIKRKMEEMFMQIIANWIMQTKMFQSVFGSSMGSAQPGAAGGAGGGILQQIMMGTAPWSHASARSASGTPVGSTIPNSGGMVMTDAGPVPMLDPTSPGLQNNFAGNGIPSISGSGQPSSNPNAGTPSIGSGLPIPGGGGSGSGGSGGSAAIGKGAQIAGAAYAGYQGYEDTKADFKSGSVSGMLKGTMQDAMAGAVIGSLFGPVGTVVGAAAGALVGLAAGTAGMIMGEGGNLAARDYYKKTLFPEIEKQRNGNGQGDWQAAVSQINRTASDGMLYMSQHWGSGAAQWVDDNYLKKEQQLALSELESRAKGGAQYVGMSANQFHSGGPITGFGSYGTSSNEGMIHAMLGETVMNPSASSQHGAVLNAMNSGADATDVARMYLGAGSSSSASGGGGDTHHHWTVNAVDARGFESMLRNGGARLIVKHTNQYASQYAGDGISG
jgi:hypothetical protein